MVAGARPKRTSDTLNSVSTDATDRKSTRLNSSHTVISYAVFCLKKKKFDHYLKNFHRQFRLICVDASESSCHVPSGTGTQIVDRASKPSQRDELPRTPSGARRKN